MFSSLRCKRDAGANVERIQFNGTLLNDCCRANPVGAEGIFQARNVQSIRILQVSWHPYSDTHLGVLSSDAIFRFHRHLVFCELIDEACCRVVLV